MHLPTRHWRLLKQRYRLFGAQCSSCGAKLLSPDKVCPFCRPHILPEDVESVAAESAVVPSLTKGQQRLAALGTFLRWKDWGLGKVPLLCTACVYVGFAYHEFSLAFVLKFLDALLFAAGHSAFGYVINDWGDRYTDRQRGKSNVFLGLSQRRALKAIVALVGVALLSGLPFVANPWFVPLWIAWGLVAVSFSLPPLRFKERGPWGWIVGLLAQWTLPACLAFAAFGHFGGWDTILFVILLTATGATLDLGQARGYYATKTTGRDR